MNVTIYSKPTCPSCVKAKQLLDSREIAYKETVIGEEINRDDFLMLYPDARSVPFIIIDGVEVGGYEQLEQYLATNKN